MMSSLYRIAGNIVNLAISFKNSAIKIWRDINLAVRRMHYIRHECVMMLLVEFYLAVCFTIGKSPNSNSSPNLSIVSSKSHDVMQNTK